MIRFILFSCYIIQYHSGASPIIRAREAIFVFPSATHLVEYVAILLSVKFCRFLFSSFKGKAQNVSANQKLGRPSPFTERLEKQTW